MQFHEFLSSTSETLLDAHQLVRVVELVEVMKENDPKDVVYQPCTWTTDLIPENQDKRSTNPFLYFSVLIICLSSISNGMMMGWMSPTATKLLSNDPLINPLGEPVTLYQLSIIGAISSLGIVMGPLLLGKLIDIYGRRNSNIIISSGTIVSIVTLALATHVSVYYISLISIGICTNGSMVGVMIYCSELTENRNRAKCICFIMLGLPLGSLLSYLSGHFLSVKYHTLLCALPLVIFVICLIVFLPESPLYSLSKGRKDLAMKALMKLRNNTFQALEIEIGEMESLLRSTESSRKRNWLVVFEKTAARRGLLIISGLYLTTILSGVPGILAYMELIFNEAETDVSSYICTIIVGTVQVICCFCASILIEKLGRRPLLLISSISTVLNLFFLGIFFYLKQIGFPFIQDLKWMPLMNMILLLIGNGIGFNSVPSALSNEMFTIDVKAFFIPLIMFFLGIESTLVVFCFPIMTKIIGFAWVFWIFALLSFLGLIFIYYKLPETRGKNLLEIQELLSR